VEEEGEHQEEEGEGEGEGEGEEEKPIHYKFLTLIKNQLKMEKDIEIQRECLFSHINFSAFDMFRQIDQDNKGYIKAEDLNKVSE
jgi:hypothetical protein